MIQKIKQNSLDPLSLQYTLNDLVNNELETSLTSPLEYTSVGKAMP